MYNVFKLIKIKGAEMKRKYVTVTGLCSLCGTEQEVITRTTSGDALWEAENYLIVEHKKHNNEELCKGTRLVPDAIALKFIS